MQLEDATALERRLYKLALTWEGEPCSGLQTRVSLALCDAANELQAMRRGGQQLLDAAVALHRWVDGHDAILGEPEFLKVYNAICDAIGVVAERRAALARPDVDANGGGT